MNKQKKIDRLSDWTAHDARMREHYDHARRKHPYFCDHKVPPTLSKEQSTACTATVFAKTKSDAIAAWNRRVK